MADETKTLVQLHKKGDETAIIYAETAGEGVKLANGKNLEEHLPTLENKIEVVKVGDNALVIQAGKTIVIPDYYKREDADNTFAKKADVYTRGETDSAIATAVADASHLKRRIVEALPSASEADANTIYMVLKASGKNGNKYDEFFLVNGEFEKIGDTEVDLTDYAKKSEINDLASGKQDKIDDLATIRSNASAGKGAADTIASYGDIVSHNASEFQTTISDLADIRANATAGKAASTTIAGYGDVVTHNASEFATKADVEALDFLSYKVIKTL